MLFGVEIRTNFKIFGGGNDIQLSPKSFIFLSKLVITLVSVD